MKKMMMILLISFMTLLCSLIFGDCLCLSQHSTKEDLSKAQVSFDKRFNDVRARIIREVSEGNVPSLSVAVAKNGKVIWEEAFGWANKEKKIKATPHTMYSLASITKPFTATGLMVLVKKGLVNLDDPVDDYLGDLKLTAYEGDARDATVKCVLNHTSGLTEYYNNFFEDEPYSCTSIEETIRRYGFLITPPGEIAQYSNIGYGIIGYIISRISKKSYAQFMKEEVFLPLNLSHTSVGIEKGKENYAAVLYDKRGCPIPSFITSTQANCEIYSSGHDLIRFGMFHLKNHLTDQKQILNDDDLQKMHSGWDPNAFHLDDYYGLGWLIDEEWNGYHVVYHGGGGAGANTMLFLIPSEDLAVTVLCNANSMVPFRVCDDIVSALLSKFAENLKKRRQSAGEKTERREVDIPAKYIGEWKGKIKTYEGEIGVSVLIQKDGDFHIKLEGQLETLVNNVRYSDFNISGIFNGKIPTKDNERYPYLVQLFLISRGDRLSGRVTASAYRDGYDAYNLSSWIELKKL